MLYSHTIKLVSQYDGCDGLKTGHTDNAGYCLAATAQRSDLRLIAIVLGEKDSKVRNKETMNLLDYGFQSIKVNVLEKKGKVVDTLFFDKANVAEVPVLLKDNLSVVEEIGDNNKYQYEIKMNSLKLPLNRGDVVGTIFVKNGNKIVSRQSLVIDKDIYKIPFFSFYLKTIKQLLVGNL